MHNLFWGKNLTSTELIQYIKSIKDQGLAIYAIFGVWLAMIFPDELKNYKDAGNGKKPSDFNAELIYPLIVGTLTLIFALSFDLLLPFLKNLLINYPEKKLLFLLIGRIMILISYAEQLLALFYSASIIYHLKRSYGTQAAISSVENSLPKTLKK